MHQVGFHYTDLLQNFIFTLHIQSQVATSIKAHFLSIKFQLSIGFRLFYRLKYE